jgi:hypothetical protein
MLLFLKKFLSIFFKQPQTFERVVVVESVPNPTIILSKPPSREYKNVGIYTFDPQIAGPNLLSQLMGYNSSSLLAMDYVKAMLEVSKGMADYRIVEQHRFDEIPVKIDGFHYEAEELLSILKADGANAHNPDEANFQAMLSLTGAFERINKGFIDEVWLFGPPYGGFFESREIGEGARWCNSPAYPIKGVRRFISMGFNYERGLGEMLEDFGHRAESLLENTPGYQEWVMINGTVHRLPQDIEDYRWQGMGMIAHHKLWLSNLLPEWWPIIR